MKKLILIVEDEHEIRIATQKILELSNYDTLVAENGVVGLKLAKERLPDLIISDIMMPEMDGLEYLAELQKEPETASIPFLFLSAKSEKHDIRFGMSLGADDYVTKPYDISELLLAIETRLKKKETSVANYSKKLEELRTNINRSLPHELKTPLSLIMGNSDYLIRKMNHLNESEFKEILTDINQAGKRLFRIFENYLFYANLESISTNEAEIKKIKMKKLFSIEFIIKELVPYIASKYNRVDDISYKLEDFELNMVEEHFIKIIEEIIDNALKFSEPGTKIVVRSSVDNDFYSLSFMNHGRGMTAEQIDNIGAYTQFERTIYEQQGIGLGLAIVKRIAELYSGKFIINSEVDKFTEVKLKFPVI